MEKYARRLYDLSKFASHRDERELAMKFVDGLSSRIRMLVAGHCCDTVDKAIAAATSIEVERGLFLTEQRQGQIIDVGEEPVSFSWRGQFFRQWSIQEGEELGEGQFWWQ